MLTWIRTAGMVTALATTPVTCDAALGEQPAGEADAFATASGLVAALYEEVTFPAGSSPDWERVRSMFLDQAIVVLRTSREDTTVFSVDGFVQDFIAFIERSKVRETGFEERVIRSKPLVFGDIAHVLVLYEVSIPGSERPPQQGVDSFQLIRKNGRWWIVAVTNEVPTAERPVPPELID
jgi:hypothetical protein